MNGNDINNSRTRTIYTACVLAVICIFAISALVLLNVAVRVYKNIAVSNLENYRLRTSLSFVATKIRQADSLGYIKLGVKDGTNVLILGEESVGDEQYETVLYHADGSLYELYHEKGADYEITNGFEVLQVESFSFFMTENGSLQLTAIDSNGNIEEMYIDVRSGG